MSYTYLHQMVKNWLIYGKYSNFVIYLSGQIRKLFVVCYKYSFVLNLQTQHIFPKIQFYHIYLKYWDTLTPYHTCPKLWIVYFIIGIKQGLSCINIRQVLWDLVNVNALKNHARLLLLHKNWKHFLHFVLFLSLFCFAFSPMSGKRNFHWLCSF